MGYTGSSRSVWTIEGEETEGKRGEGREGEKEEGKEWVLFSCYLTRLCSSTCINQTFGSCDQIPDRHNFKVTFCAIMVGKARKNTATHTMMAKIQRILERPGQNSPENRQTARIFFFQLGHHFTTFHHFTEESNYESIKGAINALIRSQPS